MATNVKTIELLEIGVKYATICIEGDSDLVLNKMNASSFRELTADDRKKQKLWENQHINKWERIITSLHWRDGIPVEDTNQFCDEALFMEMLKNNAPCISAFGMKKSWGAAVTRNKIDQYSTKFDNAVNITAKGGLIPVTFSDWSLDVRPMTGKGKNASAVTAMLNHFSGWSAEIPISFTENVYSLSEIVTIINYAGFGVGVGSGRTSGYGRYKVVAVK